MGSNLHTLLVGLNYKIADLDLREKLHFENEYLNEALKILYDDKSVHECAILSTCNRVELYVGAYDKLQATKELIQFLSNFHGVPENTLKEHVYIKECGEAVQHLYNVSSSLDSLVVGENQILGQIKTAYETSLELGYTNTLTNKLFQSAISIGKKVRTETNIGLGSSSVGSASVDLIKNIFPKNFQFQALILGAGKISKLTINSLKSYTNVDIMIINRSSEKAIAIAKEINGAWAPWEERYQYITQSDVILVSTSSPEFVIKKDDLSSALKSASRHMTLFIDLSVPRNIQPSIQDIDNVVLYCIDDLQSIVGKSLKKREQEIQNCKEIIEESTQEFTQWFNSAALINDYKKWKSNIIEELSKALQLEDEGKVALLKSTLDKLTSKYIPLIKLISDKASAKKINSWFIKK